jgi:Protein RETICULATA-related
MVACIHHAAFKRMLHGVPSAAFEPNKPGLRYGVGARVGCLGVKFLEYSLAGMVCGFIGQGIANQMMHLKCAPPLVLIWSSLQYADAAPEEQRLSSRCSS